MQTGNGINPRKFCASRKAVSLYKIGIISLFRNLAIQIGILCEREKLA